MTTEKRYATMVVGVVLAAVLGWNLYRAEVESRPLQGPSLTVANDPAAQTDTTSQSTAWSLGSPSTSPSP